MAANTLDPELPISPPVGNPNLIFYLHFHFRIAEIPAEFDYLTTHLFKTILNWFTHRFDSFLRFRIKGCVITTCWDLSWWNWVNSHRPPHCSPDPKSQSSDPRWVSTRRRLMLPSSCFVSSSRRTLPLTLTCSLMSPNRISPLWFALILLLYCFLVVFIFFKMRKTSIFECWCLLDFKNQVFEGRIEMSTSCGFGVGFKLLKDSF